MSCSRRRRTLKGVLLRSEAEPANTPLVEQARFYEEAGKSTRKPPAMALVFLAD